MHSLLFLLTLSGQSADGLVISAAKDDAGILVHDIESPFQAGVTKLRVLRPEKIAADAKLPVIYVLPVEPGDEHRFGNGLTELQKLRLHEKHQALFVAPTFSHLPWYADHPTDKTIRQETYLLEVVLPFVEKTYPAKAERDGRLLLGFSKSGWGAWSLLLRHPDVFARAAAWDAPLMMDRPGKYGSGEIFGSDENFAAYRLTDLVPRRAADLTKHPRLILTSYGNFRAEHEKMHALLDEHKVPHLYRDGPELKHHWAGGWLAESVELLMQREP